ncbi:hypothetical protein [uncultured Clostridium sp.]|uniref:hypothetical protein n=1 Tax=uncultured Clostridium sp. TaxID=59620 RepID=UPI002635FD0C|nr:hypothetical protein [uncultured Clostridium sp.]
MITEKLFEEIAKLSKSEWQAVSTNVNHAYSSEARKRDKELFLDNTTIRDSVLSGPYFIKIQSE